MKYNERFTKKTRTKLTTHFYITVAVCLLIIGGASWFALSNIEEQPNIVKDNQSYKDNTSSYIESQPEKIIEDEVDKNLESEVYQESSKPIKKVPEIKFMMAVEGEIIKDFSNTSLQFSKTYSDMRMHKGIDIACSEETPVNAVGDGFVKDIIKSADYGTTVITEHSNGLLVKYSSLKNLRVKKGDKVKMGDVLGVSSDIPCECMDDSHIHLEVEKNNITLEPLKTLGLK